jgi:hypothetical protein
MTLDTNFNWVAERLRCSPTKVFQQLVLGVEADVKTLRAALPANRNYEFETALNGGRIMVTVTGGDFRHSSVIFEQTERGILVRKDDKVILDATLTLNDEGECRLKVGDKEYELWQFRKKGP